MIGNHAGVNGVMGHTVTAPEAEPVWADQPPSRDLYGTLEDLTLAELTDIELLAAIRSARRQTAASHGLEYGLHYELSRRRVAQDAEDNIPHSDRGKHAADELSIEIGITQRAAGRQIDRAYGLAALPATFGALRTGKINEWAANIIADWAGDPELPEGVAELIESAMLKAVVDHHTGRLRRLGEQLWMDLAPLLYEQRRQRAKRGRRLELRDDVDGTSTLLICQIGKAIAHRVFDQLRADAKELQRLGDDRGLHQIMVDLILRRALGVLDEQDRENTDNPTNNDATNDDNNNIDDPDGDSGGPDGGGAPNGDGGGPSDGGGPGNGGDGSRSAADANNNNDAPDTNDDGPDDDAGDDVVPWPEAPSPSSPDYPDDLDGTDGAAADNEGVGEAAGWLRMGAWTRRRVRLGDAAPFADVPPGPDGTCGRDRPCGRCGEVSWLPDHGVWWARLIHSPGTRLEGLQQQALALLRDGVCVTITGPDGTVFQHGSGTYTPSPGMRRLLNQRHGYCCFPGCMNRAHKSDLDHTEPWPAGPTCPCDLAPACRRHHRMKTHWRRWRLEQPEPGLMIWTTPAGRRFEVDLRHAAL